MDYEINIRGLDQLIKALSGKLPSVRIGVIGKDHRDDGTSNAEVGTAHEFGTKTLPVRSFLRVPLTEHLETFLEKNRALDPDILREVVKIGTIIPWLQKVAVTAEEVVQEGFDTGGFGKWPPSDFTKKKVAMTLVETQQLRNSISSEVK